MKSIKTMAALFAVFGMGSFAQAGLFNRGGDCGASKCCDCAPTFQPKQCKPTIVRPCHRNVYNYQRSCAKASGCDTGCGPANSCAPCGNGAGDACAAGAGNCAAPCGTGAGCVDGAGNGCVNGAGSCAAPCGAGTACADGAGAGCVNGAGSCAAPCGAGAGCADGAGNGCVAGTGPNCAAPCAGNGDACCGTTCKDACEIAELIYTSQTACYARQRKAALKKLGRKYDCVCNPEIMSAFIFGLNDCDEKVREVAADEIGDQLRKNKCCCTQCVVNALTVALADCDRGVRRQAEQGLKQCGYKIVDPTCCEVACDNACDGNNCVAGTGCVGGVNCGTVAPAAAPVEVAPSPAAAPNAPAPPSEPKAYFPKRISDENARPVTAKKSLSNLFGMVR